MVYKIFYVIVACILMCMSIKNYAANAKGENNSLPYSPDKVMSNLKFFLDGKMY